MTSLYLHLPFCSRWCDYCAFYSEEYPTWESWSRPYVRRLSGEIREATKTYGPFETIFLGGGNPLSLRPADLSELLVSAGNAKEVTVEMNPESLDDRYEPLFASGLVTRASMGIQSLAPTLLSVLGRNSEVGANMRGIRRLMQLKERYHIQVNFDMITCVPTESIRDAKDDIDRLLDVSDPEHLSVYSLTLEKCTPLARKVREGRLRMPDGQEQAKMLFSVWDHLASKGFEHYEVSNFAKAGAYCSHNLRYWHLEPYLGLGSHAASRLSSPDGLMEMQNSQSLVSFAKGKGGSGYRSRLLTRKEEMEEYLLTNLRTKWGVGKNTFRIRFGCSFDDVFAPAVERIPRQWIRDGKDAFALTEEGMMVLDDVVLRLAMLV